MRHLAVLAVLGCVAVAAAVALMAMPVDEAQQAVITGAPHVAFVINLRRNADRLARFQKAYARSDMATVPLHRIEAVDGAQLSDAELRALLTPDAYQRLRAMRASGVRQAHQDLTPGAVGCYMSHVEVWRRLAAGGAPYVFVFEDDASVPRSALAQFEAVRAQIPPDWDLLLLGYDGDGTPVGPHARKVSDFRRTHAYVVSANGARKLLRSMLPMSQQVDWELSNHILSKQLRVYGAVPEVVPAEWLGTDIQSPLQDA